MTLEYKQVFFASVFISVKEKQEKSCVCVIKLLELIDETPASAEILQIFPSDISNDRRWTLSSKLGLFSCSRTCGSIYY